MQIDQGRIPAVARGGMGLKVVSVLAVLALLITLVLVEIFIVGEPRSTSHRHSRKRKPPINRRDGGLAGKLDAALEKAAVEKKIILLWHPEDHPTVVAMNGTDQVLQGKSCGLCVVTANKSKINDSDTAAVIFFFRYVKPETMPAPQLRRTDQLYIWQTQESPAYLKGRYNYDFDYADSIRFNATIMYRRDADIYHPYGTVGHELRHLETDLKKILKLKKKLAVSFVTNCHFAHARVRVSLLKRIVSSGFQLDAKGRCFDNAMAYMEKEDFIDFLKSYKFYFAFENSYHCRDYVTEKVFRNAFDADSVPVVWGATKRDYERILPINSFIHVESFSSLKELTDYLNFLNKNDTAYLEYFSWRSKKGRNFSDNKQKNGMCQLCRIVHGINVDDVYSPAYNPDAPERPLLAESTSHRTILPSLSEWVLGTENKQCLNKDPELKF